jgi:hypothetical protein
MTVALPPRRSLVSIAIILIATTFMAVSTWGTWPDAIYDFGSQLYYPWQMTAGKRLYVDIAYFNGPFSQYFNAAMFWIFGASLRTLVLVNLAILIGAIALIYRLITRLSDSMTATCAGVVFVMLFAFSQYVGIGNYNWICPYTHEVTHGVALSLAMVAAMDAMLRTNRHRWALISGGLLGLVFLTKAEVFVPAAGAAVVGLLMICIAPSPGTPGDGRGEGGFEPDVVLKSSIHPHPNPLPEYRERGPDCMRRQIFWFASACVGVIAIAFAIIAITTNTGVAARAIEGSWPWVFDRRIAQLQFYRQGLGIDDLTGNLWKMAVIGGASVAVLATLVASGLFPKKRRGVVLIVLAGELIAMICFWRWAVQIARPWPGFLAVIAGVSLVKARQANRDERMRWIVRAMLSVFAFGLLGKMLLNARVWQYGFALAMPAAVMLIDAVIGWMPVEMTRLGGDGRRARLASLAVVVIATVCVFANQYHSGGVLVGKNGDQFLAISRGNEVNDAIARIEMLVPRDGTLAVMPQGLMLNYLTRRPNPIACVNLMPPEVLTMGEDHVVEQLNSHPPDLVVLSETDLADGSFVLTDGQCHYGAKIVAWIVSHYQRIVPPDESSDLKLSYWKRG